MSIPAVAAAAPAQGIRGLRQHKPFLFLMAARVISRFGDSLDSIAYSWMVYMLTGSKLLMGTIFAINFIPGIVFSLFTGVLVDRWSKKAVIITSYAARGAIVALTALLYWKGWLQPWHLFIFTFMNSSFECFSSPAEMSVVPRLLPKELLLSGNSLSASSSRTAELAGLAAAGALIAAFGLSGAILIDAGTFFTAAAVLAFMRISPIEDCPPATSSSAAASSEATYWSQFKEGMSFVRSHRLIMLTMLTAAVLNVCLTPHNVMETVYVKEVLHSGPSGQSIMGIGFMGGMIASGLLISAYGARFRKSSLIVFGCLLLGVSQALYIIPSLIQWHSLAVVTVFSIMGGLAVPMIGTPVSTYMMEVTPKNMLGRIGALSGMIGSSLIPLGSVATGFAGQHLPIQTLYLLAGLIMIIPGLLLLTQKNFMKI